MAKAARISSLTEFEGKFLCLDRIGYRDRRGRERTWEAAMRRGNRGAVEVIPLLHPSDRLLLIQQYRPPMDAVVLEFPAGLIDAGEAPENTAVREVREETGYTGTVRWISSPTCSSPGMTGETVHLAIMDIDETAPQNLTPEPQLEDGEDIEVLCVPRRGLAELLRTKVAEGFRVDSRTAAYAIGLGVTW